jgi:hypothetical protein
LRGYASDWLHRYEDIAANAAKTLPEFLDDLKTSLREKSDAHMAERELHTRFQKKTKRDLAQNANLGTSTLEIGS